MDLIEAKMERRLNVQKAIEFVAESWNSIGGRSFEVAGSKVRSSKRHRLRICVHKTTINSPASPPNNTDAICLIFFLKLGVTVIMDDYVEIGYHEQIHEEQEALIEAEVEPAEVESDEDQAPVSAKEALKCCLLLRSYFIRSDEATRIIQSDLDKMSSVIRKNRHARAKQLDMRDFI